MPNDLVETIATLAIIVGWGLLSVLRGVLRKEKQKPRPPAPERQGSSTEPASSAFPPPPPRPAVAPRPAADRQRPFASARMPPPPPAAQPAGPAASSPEEEMRRRAAEVFRRLGLDVDEMSGRSGDRPAARPASPPPPPTAPQQPPSAPRTSRWDPKPVSLEAPPPLLAPDESHSMLGAPAPLGGEGPGLRQPAAGGGLALEVLEDLRGGPASLARAVLLSEILGPPVALRSPDDRPA
ncbi:MAG: hypothetical protein KDD11_13835 [Acidobacteria bacterium]|nr:hypothetical protein [Acidobacteriota bacterium]